MSTEDHIGREHDLSEQYEQPELVKQTKEWESACNKKEDRTEKEIWEDFYEKGFC